MTTDIPEADSPEAAAEPEQDSPVSDEMAQVFGEDAAAKMASDTETLPPEEELLAPAEPEPEDTAEAIDEEATEDELLYEKAQEAAAGPREISPFDKPGKWYVAQTASGHEKRTKSNLEARIKSMNAEDKVFEVVIPTEDRVEFKQGKKVVVPKKVFPGYLLVRCFLNDSSWTVIRETPGVTGFVGAGSKPFPLKRQEVEMFLQHKSDGEDVSKRIRPQMQYESGDMVRVKEGPFADFQGEVTEINEDQLKVKVLLNIFGRETPVELEFSQVVKP